MRTDVDTCLIQIADWFVKNRHTMKEPELRAILVKHCVSEQEVRKFVDFLETEPGQLRFRTLLRERGESRGVIVVPPSTLTKEPWQMTQKEYIATGTERGRREAGQYTLKSNHYQSVKNALADGKPVPAEVLKDYPDLAIPKTRVTSLGFQELELPVAKAVEALVEENPWSSGFHGALNQRWTIVFRGKISDKAVNAAKVAGLEVSYREAPKGSGQILTDVSLVDVGVSEIEKATQVFDRFAELYEGSLKGKYYYGEESQAKTAKSYAEGLGYKASLQYRNGRWELTVEPSQLQVEEPCQIISPRYYDILGLLDSVPSSSLLLEPEVKEHKIDELLEKLKQGVEAIQSSPVFREFLITLSKFHDYSFGNCILIMLQRPSATRVAGYNTWKDLGRYVKKGERGIAILAPCLPPKGEAVQEIWRNQGEWVLRGRYIYARTDGGLTLVQTSPTKEAAESWLRQKGARRVAAEEVELQPRYFKVVYVFDVSQTEGKPLPEVVAPPLSGAANEELFNKAMVLAKGEGLEVSFESRPELDPRVKGQFMRPNKIWVRPEESRADQLGSLLHEESHYFTEEVFRIPRADAETIAESACFAVGAHFGFDTGVYSFPYVAVWSKDKKVLDKNLTTMRKVAITMIQRLEAVKVSSMSVETETEKQLKKLASQIDHWQKWNNEIQHRDVEDFTIAIREMGLTGLWARYNIPKSPAFKRIGAYNVSYQPAIGDIIEKLIVSKVAPPSELTGGQQYCSKCGNKIKPSDITSYISLEEWGKKYTEAKAKGEPLPPFPEPYTKCCHAEPIWPPTPELEIPPLAPDTQRVETGDFGGLIRLCNKIGKSPSSIKAYLRLDKVPSLFGPSVYFIDVKAKYHKEELAKFLGSFEVKGLPSESRGLMSKPLDIKELRAVMECAEGKIRSNRVVYVGCAESSQLWGKVLGKLGVRRWQRKFGWVTTIEGERLSHCWIEAEDVVIETNPSQILGINKMTLAMDKALWEKVTEPEVSPEIIDAGLTPAGERFYDSEAEQILQCYRGKVG